MSKNVSTVNVWKKANKYRKTHVIIKKGLIKVSLKLFTNGSKAQTMEGNKVKNKDLKSFLWTSVSSYCYFNVKKIILNS